MKTLRTWTLAASLTLLAAAHADTIYLSDGRELHGTIEMQDNQNVVIKLNNGQTRSFRRTDVDTIVREKPVAREEPKNPEKVGGTTPAVDVAKPGGSPNSTTAPLAPPLAPNVTLVPPTPHAPLTTESAATTPANAAVAPGVKPDVVKGVEEAATGENPMPGFPEHAKRLGRKKEGIIALALDAIKNGDDAARESARANLQALGSDVLPYLWAGAQHENAFVRIESTKLIGMMNGRNCIKRIIETFYATMPDSGQAATFNVPFIRAIQTTLEQLTGQTFITVQANRPLVQDGLKKYVEWYNQNWEKVVKQVGEPDLDVTDLDYTRKLRELRQLKLSKRDWPRPANMPVDLVQGPNPEGPPKDPPPMKKGFAETAADQKFGDELPTISRDKAFQRDPIKDPNPSPTKADGLKREVDRANDTTGHSSTARDGDVKPLPSETATKKNPDPFKRPQDLVRDQNNP